MLQDSARSQFNRLSGLQEGKCDRKLVPGWYRFKGGAGTKMPESCVLSLHCGTHSPGWYDGPHPANVGGISSGRVCFSWMGVCCQWSSPAKVRRCNGFYVYRLSPTSHCALLYCGNGTAGRKNARGWGLAVVCRLWGGGGGWEITRGTEEGSVFSNRVLGGEGTIENRLPIDCQ